MTVPDTVFLLKVMPRTPGTTFFYAYVESVQESSTAIIAENVQSPKVTNDNADGQNRLNLGPRFLGDLTFTSDRYAALAYPVNRPRWFARRPDLASKATTKL